MTTKLSAKKALQIKAIYATGTIGLLAIAKQYGVSKAQIRRIIRGEAWK